MDNMFKYHTDFIPMNPTQSYTQLYQQLCFTHVFVKVAKVSHVIERNQSAFSHLALYNAHGAIAYIKPCKAR